MVLERQYGSLFTRHTASCAKLVSALCCGEQETHRRKTGYLSGVIKEGGDSSSFFFCSENTEQNELRREDAFSLQQSRVRLQAKFHSSAVWAALTGPTEPESTAIICDAKIHINALSTSLYRNVSLLHLLLLLFFFLRNQIYEKHNHNMRALLFYYQWVLLLENHFKWYVTWEQISFTNH